MDNNRFSVLKLENDVLEYSHLKKKFNFYDNKLKKSCFRRKHFENKKSFYYKKYISKLSYLEKNYRSINIYTDYHRQLENNFNNDHVPIATIIEPTAPIANHLFWDD